MNNNQPVITPQAPNADSIGEQTPPDLTNSDERNLISSKTITMSAKDPSSARRSTSVPKPCGPTNFDTNAPNDINSDD